MVFRKPYGFLIKHFRLIHLIITFILGYLVYNGSNIYSFINSCIDNSFYKQDALNYVNYGIYILFLLVIGLFFIVFLLLKYKDKPRKIYVYSIVGYLVVGIYMFLLFGYMSKLPGSIIDQKVIRAYRDIMVIMLVYQYLMIIIMFIRGLGFNIKKFNFEKDMQELNLTQEDNEEVEVNINIDTNSLMRNVRKQKRELGYYFQEYKIFILIIVGIIIIIMLFNFGSFFKGLFVSYGENEVVGNINFVTIKDSYYNITDNDNYVIVKFDIFKYGVKEQFNLDSMVLMVENDKYYPNKNVCYNFNKLGNCYKKQFITNDNTSYIVSYKIDSVNTKKTYLLYKETYDNSFKIKLDLENYE